MEDFALSTDREKALDQLIPGTEDYYYYNCLYLQHSERFEKVEPLLEVWVERHGHTGRVEEIRNRQVLLRYGDDPEAARERIRDQLNLVFNHQRRVDHQETSYPIRLDAKAIGREAFKRDAMNAYNNTDGFSAGALEWLAAEDLDGDRRRHLLQRLVRPDLPNMVELVLADLDFRHSGGFGSIPIHHKLLDDQLTALAKKKRGLLKDDQFVHARLKKLKPGPDVDWQAEPQAKGDYLESLWHFVEALAPAFNALKVHVLYHLLEHGQRRGTFNRKLFELYLTLPRSVSYAEPDYLNRKDLRDHTVHMGQDFNAVTGLDSVHDDEALVRAFLEHFFVEAHKFKPFDTYIRTSYLKRVFAITKILAGVGDMEEHYSMLDDPSAYQALKERVDIEFAPENADVFGAADSVSLLVDIKNVETLVVKVFEINTLNYFLANSRPVDTTIDLDGLVATEQQTHKYSEPALRRVRRSFDFPSLDRPGLFVIELIGNGRSSRALIRKGGLRFLERIGAAGHVFTLLDEKNQPQPEASLWLSGREYKASKDGCVRVPFSTRPGRQTILLRHGQVTSLETFDHQAENYQFQAGLHVDRESLLKRRKAKLLVRPQLNLNGFPVPLSLIEDPSLVVESVDRNEISSVAEVAGFSLESEAEAEYEFQVPEDLTRLTVTVKGRVECVTRGEKQDLSVSRSFELNGIEQTSHVDDLHLSRTAEGHVLYLLGKTGEFRADTPVNLVFHHRDFTRQMHLTLQSDDRGRVELGALEGITQLTAENPAGVEESWWLHAGRARIPSSLHGLAGKPLRLCCPEFSTKLDRTQVSLLEKRGDTYLVDRFDAVSLKEGQVVIDGLEPGDYDLFLKSSGNRVRLRLTDGRLESGWVLSGRRQLELQDRRPLSVSALETSDFELTVKLENAGENTRVHVFASRFWPSWSLFDSLGRLDQPESAEVQLTRGTSAYKSGRDIGDEYRYILDRKFAKKFPGIMLSRPGLLLNPWAVRKTDTDLDQAEAGDDYSAGGEGAKRMSARRPMPQEQAAGGGGLFANLDFLAEPCMVLSNLKPDENGRVVVERKALAHGSLVRILAVDHRDAIERQILLPEVDTAHQDLRLEPGLDLDEHFTEKKQVSPLQTGEAIEIEDITTSELELYDSLSRVYKLFTTLSGDAHLTEFAFVLDWPSQSDEQKRAKYSEFACHELSLFIARKDPDFFRTVVQPYLRYKKDKTFLDHYLIEDDLSDYLKPWAFARLNVVEQILLAGRIQGQGDLVSRHVGERFDLLTPNIEFNNHLFDTSISGSALDTDDALGFGAAQDKAVAKAKKKESRRMRSAPKMAMAPPAPPASAGPMASMVMADPACEAPCEAALDDGLDGFAEESFDEDDDMEYEEESREKADIADLDERSSMRAFYQKLDKTQEWAENNYYHLTIEQHLADRVVINAFWRDFARHDGRTPFLSRHVASAASNFTEMMCALAVLDLPFVANKPEVAYKDASMTLKAKSPGLVFHKEIKPTSAAELSVPILVSQNYFRADDRYRYEGGETFDKYVTGEYLLHTVYLCQVVLTNPTSSRQKLDLLMQIPRGSLPVESGFRTRGRHVQLEPYATESIEYSFYFPHPGEFEHYPVQVAKNEALIASAAAGKLKAVRQLSQVDRTSWAWLSQNGKLDEVLTYLEQNNIARLDLSDIAWRMGDQAFYRKVIDLLAARHTYETTLWSYSLLHGDDEHLREYLLHADGFLRSCGLWLRSPLIDIDPVEHFWYQHLEYAPLVNARAHPLGGRHKILNNRFKSQFEQFLAVQRYKPELADTDWLAACYYLLLQDRTEDGLQAFDRVDSQKIPSRIQYDYLHANVMFYRQNFSQARELASRYAEHPVDRWRNLFTTIVAQVDEAEGAASKVVDEDDRAQRQADLASTESGFEFSIEGREVTIDYQNLGDCRVNYYPMDVELLFSKQPFVQQDSGSFSFIRPSRSDALELPAKQQSHSFQLPEDYRSTNIIVEIVAAGIKRSQAHYANQLRIQLTDNYGQVRVQHQQEGRPLPTSYVKVYARNHDGGVRFYKDGYTDLRGRFDYASLSTDELEQVERFALLIFSDEHGAVIREAAPPKR